MSATVGPRRAWNVLDREDTAPPAPPPQPVQQQAHVDPTEHALAMRMIMLGMQQLSQRFVVGLAALWTTTFTAGLVASAFALWWRVLPEPNVLQLIGLAGYAAFVLLIEVVRRRRLP